MKELKCPHCGKVFQVDESEYASILSQVKQDEISHQVHIELEKERATSLLKNKEREEVINSNHQKEINELKEEINKLNNLLSTSSKDKEIAVLEAKKETEDELKKKDIEITRLQGDIKVIRNEALNEKNNIINRYTEEIKEKDNEIALYKDKKAKLSVKLLGEDLEQHCLRSFDQIRMQGFQDVYFEKDNEVVEGSKGDFIYREKTSEGAELLSIMFEMKNEADESDKKHKNEDFYAKLDKDRRNKNCEYAVLVSMLELDNEYFNAGIVDVSYKYPKMYVVRPNCFIPLITLLRNAAYRNKDIRNELVAIKNENLDVTNFENAVKVVAQKINDDYENAGKQYDKVEKMCDDMIKKLTDLKEAFRLGKKWIGTAQNQLPELEIRKLTKNNPTMKAKFDALKDEK